MATDTKKSVKAVYDQGMAQVIKIVGSIKATQAQKKVALQSSRDLTAMLLAQSLASVEARTALLAGLIVELNQVTDSIKAKPPYPDTLKNLDKVIAKATTLYNSEKKDLLT